MNSPFERPFWGDIHNHNEVGYGKGSLARSYALARAAALDFYAFTPHAWWPDLSDDDPAVARKHRDGFDRVERLWPEVIAKANAEYRPGEFVSFCAFEWHSNTWGDYHVLLPGPGGAICRAADVAELQAWARQNQAILVPHHLGYRQGWRGANWQTWAADVSPVADGFSEHGNGIEAETHLAMVNHSMGGVERSQTVLEQWKAGRIVGVAASTDNHWGYPASYGEGLTGIWAENLTREGILDAWRKRRTFAVSGDRITAWLECDDGVMGDLVSPGAGRQFRAEVTGWGAIDGCEIWKNGRPWRRFVPPAATPGEEILVRVEFGWGGMNDRGITEWKLSLQLDGAEILSAMPAFCGGEGSITKLNRFISLSNTEVGVEAFTARTNSRPTSAFVLRIRGTPAATLRLDATADWSGQPGGCRLESTAGRLLGETATAAISPVFSAPRIAVSAVPAAAAQAGASFLDPDPGVEDFYFLKVHQRNGQCAWTTPIWFTERAP